MFVELEVLTGCNCGGVVDVGFVVVVVVEVFGLKMVWKNRIRM